MALPDIFDATMRLPGAAVRVQPGAPRGISSARHVVCLFGVMLAAGTADEAVIQQVTSPEQGVELFGEGSQLAAMIRAAKRHNPMVDMRAIGTLEDAGGTAATRTITISGTATEAGSLVVYIAGQRVAVAVAEDDAFGDVAAALEAKIDATLSLPVTAGVALGVVTVTCRWKGEIGNAIDVRSNYYPGEKTPAGLTVVIADGVTGATDPSFAAAIAAVPDDEQIHTWILPTTTSAVLTAFTDELATRAGASVGLPGQAFAAHRAAYAATQAIGAGQNSESLTIYGDGITASPPWELAAAGGAIDAATLDLNVSREGEVIRGFLPATTAFSKSDRNLLLQDGISTFTHESRQAVMERVITTRNSTAGVDDLTQLDIGIRRVINYLRFDLITFVRLRYRQHKLVDNEDVKLVAPGVKVVSPELAAEAFKERYRQHIAVAYMRDAGAFDEALILELSGEPGRLNVAGKVTPVNALIQVAIDLTFSL